MRGPFGEKNFSKKVYAEKKLKGGPFRFFQHPFCRKKLKGKRLGQMVSLYFSHVKTSKEISSLKDPVQF